MSSIFNSKFDVIHTHSYLSFYILGMEKKFKDKTIIKHIHSIYGKDLQEFTGWSVSKIFSLFENSLIKSDCTAYIVPSEFTKKKLQELGVKKDIHVVPHAPEYDFYPEKNVARKELGIPENKKVVGFIGRLSKGKGPQDIVATWKDIVSKVPESLLLIIGPEPEVGISGIKGIGEELKETLRSADIQEKVIFTGTVKEELMPYYIASFDVYVSPSINEGFGLSILNSMAAGVPVVAYRNSAIPEVVDKAGILVETGDKKSLKNAILSILLDEKLREELSFKSKERASLYSWENVKKMLMEIYSSYK